MDTRSYEHVFYGESSVCDSEDEVFAIPLEEEDFEPMTPKERFYKRHQINPNKKVDFEALKKPNGKPLSGRFSIAGTPFFMSPETIMKASTKRRSRSEYAKVLREYEDMSESYVVDTLYARGVAPPECDKLTEISRSARNRRSRLYGLLEWIMLWCSRLYPTRT